MHAPSTSVIKRINASHTFQLFDGPRGSEGGGSKNMYALSKRETIKRSGYDNGGIL